MEKLLRNLATSDLAKRWLFAGIRHGIAVAVPVLIANGVLQQSQANDLLGSVLFLAAVGWSWWQKHAQVTARTAAKAAK